MQVVGLFLLIVKHGCVVLCSSLILWHLLILLCGTLTCFNTLWHHIVYFAELCELYFLWQKTWFANVVRERWYYSSMQKFPTSESSKDCHCHCYLKTHSISMKIRVHSVQKFYVWHQPKKWNRKNAEICGIKTVRCWFLQNLENMTTCGSPAKKWNRFRPIS